MSEPCDIASLAVFRSLFGALMAASALRFMANGWVERCFGERSFFFTYYGFSWVKPLAVPGMYAVYAALFVLAVCVSLGFVYRLSIAAYFLLFSYAELTDVTNYLNHYYLVSLIALLMCFMPLSGAWSIDVLRKPERARSCVPRYMLWLLRFQITLVYEYAALAKWGTDWLWYGEPLRSWLIPQVDLPVVGSLLLRHDVGVALSWAGMLHDLLVPPLMMWRRTRKYAFAALLVFHALTSGFFNIGIFPVLMPLLASLFFEPSWPRGLWKRWGRASRSDPRRFEERVLLSRSGAALLGAYCAVQLLWPLRSHAYGGNVLWHEQGMRFSWRVMLHAKYGSVRYLAELSDGRELSIMPRRYLTVDQEREMSGQPDLILQLGQRVAEELRMRGKEVSRLRVEAYASLNGRAPRLLIDPSADLLQVHDGLLPARWIMPAPDGPPR